MSNHEQFEQFMDRVMQRPLPQNAMARVRLLARELAEGAALGLWDAGISHFRGAINDRPVLKYRLRRWDGIQPDELEDFSQQINYTTAAPDLSLLVRNGYLEVAPNNANFYLLTRAAFDLVEETEPANIFISYRRKDSSAFALLLLARLKAEGLEPFLDLALVPGEDWRAGLKERLQSYDYFIVLIGQETLTSDVVLEEIAWALEAGLIMIPIWHNGFAYRREDWPKLPPMIDEMLRTRHTIRVVEENPLYYNSAVVELLNRFGVTP